MKTCITEVPEVSAELAAAVEDAFKDVTMNFEPEDPEDAEDTNGTTDDTGAEAEPTVDTTPTREVRPELKSSNLGVPGDDGDTGAGDEESENEDE